MLQLLIFEKKTHGLGIYLDVLAEKLSLAQKNILIPLQEVKDEL